MPSSGSRQTIVCSGNASEHLIAHAVSKFGCCNFVEMMNRDVGTAYAVETPFCCQIQRLVCCIFEFLRNSCFSKGGSGDENHQDLVAQMTERAEGLNLSSAVERRTIDELWEELRKAHVDGYEDGMVSQLEGSTPFVFCLIAASDVDELLSLYRSLHQHRRAGFDEDMSDAASFGESQSSGTGDVMDLSNEGDASMLDEDEDGVSGLRVPGCEIDQSMDCD